MDKGILKALTGVVWLSAMPMCAQSTVPDSLLEEIRVRRFTLMQQYAPDLVVPAEERERMKEERITTVRYREAVIDTLDIPDWRKRRLRRELYRTPFTDEWDKVFTSMEPENHPE